MTEESLEILRKIRITLQKGIDDVDKAIETHIAETRCIIIHAEIQASAARRGITKNEMFNIIKGEQLTQEEVNDVGYMISKFEIFIKT